MSKGPSYRILDNSLENFAMAPEQSVHDEES